MPKRREEGGRIQASKKWVEYHIITSLHSLSFNFIISVTFHIKTSVDAFQRVVCLCLSHARARVNVEYGEDDEYFEDWLLDKQYFFQYIHR
jgi:hypothetical protein